MDPQDFFDANDTNKKEETLVAKFERERLEWTTRINDMSSQMKKMTDLAELMTNVYTERQRSVDYYHYLISILIKINRKYRKDYADRYDFWSFKSQIRYPNESGKVNKILTELAEILEKRDLIESHSKFIDKTTSTLDNLIYAIPKRIELEQISRGK